jgi:hypothetical protein
MDRDAGWLLAREYSARQWPTAVPSLDIDLEAKNEKKQLIKATS